MTSNGFDAAGGPGGDTGLLSVRDLSVRFGGVLAVDHVSFDVAAGEVLTLIGPNGAGKTTVFNLISRLVAPSGGSIRCWRELTALPAHAIAALGIARTFQNIELFEHASVLQNLLIGFHVHRRTGFWADLLHTPVGAARRTRRAAQGRGSDGPAAPAAAPRRAGGGPALRCAQGGRAGARAVHGAAPAAARRALVRPQCRGDRGHVVVDPRYPQRARRDGADGGARHEPVSRVSDRVLAINRGACWRRARRAKCRRIPAWPRPISARSTTWLRCGGRHEHRGRDPCLRHRAGPWRGAARAGQPGERLRPGQGHPRRQPAVRRGSIATVLGANGAGKSTILKTISGVLDPTWGPSASAARTSPGTIRRASCGAGCATCRRGARYSRCCRCATT